MKIKGILIALITIIVIIIGTPYLLREIVFPYKYDEYVDKYSKEYNVDPLLVLSIMKVESNFNEEAVSHRNAKGLMQIMDDTGEWIAGKIGIDYFMSHMLYDPEISIKMGCWYLADLENEFDDLSLVLAAYNGGRGNVNEWLDKKEYSSDGENLDYIPFPETKKYVEKVETYYKVYKYLYKE